MTAGDCTEFTIRDYSAIVFTANMAEHKSRMDMERRLYVPVFDTN